MERLYQHSNGAIVLPLKHPNESYWNLACYSVYEWTSGDILFYRNSLKSLFCHHAVPCPHSIAVFAFIHCYWMGAGIPFWNRVWGRIYRYLDFGLKFWHGTSAWNFGMEFRLEIPAQNFGVKTVPKVLARFLLAKILSRHFGTVPKLSAWNDISATRCITP